MGVVEGKSVVMPLSFNIQIKHDLTFKMKYSMSLNSQWFQKYRQFSGFKGTFYACWKSHASYKHIK